MGISSSVLRFVELPIAAMQRLQTNNKVNLILKFCQCLAIERPDKSGLLMSIHRVPFGLIQYCIEFVTCTNVILSRTAKKTVEIQNGSGHARVGNTIRVESKGPNKEKCGPEVYYQLCFMRSKEISLVLVPSVQIT
ncbi:hypothetical protein ACROYT_G015321 [Oculina patagonica]